MAREGAGDVRVALRNVLAVAREDAHFAVVQNVDLCALAVILVLASELDVGEAVEDLLDAVRGLGEHRLDGDARDEVARGGQLRHAVAQHHGDDPFEARALAEDGLHDALRLGEPVREPRLAPAAVAGALLLQQRGVGERGQHGLLREPHAELTLEPVERSGGEE